MRIDSPENENDSAEGLPVMSRPRSAETIAREQERAIRRHRRELRRGEREAKAADRAERKRRHELAQGANLRIKTNGDFSMRNVLHGRETWFCKICKTAKPSTEMIAPDICYQCHFKDDDTEGPAAKAARGIDVPLSPASITSGRPGTLTQMRLFK